MIDNVTVILLTWNEAPNIARSLAKLFWLRDVIVVDSGSNDGTKEIACTFPNVSFFERRFDNHSNQWNFALKETGIRTEWVLTLDADYVLTDDLIDEIQTLSEKPLMDGYFVKFKYCVFGKPLRGTILPPRLVLFRKDKGLFEHDGHTQRLKLEGKASQLRSAIFHDDRKLLSRWLWVQDRYALIEVDKLIKTPNCELSYPDKIRKYYVLAPSMVFLYCLLAEGGILDGWRGWFYAFQRALAEILLSLRLMEVRIASKASSNG